MTPVIPSGQASPSSPLAITTVTPIATVGGMSAAVLFSGQAPGFVGLNQVNLQIPANAPVGGQDLILSVNGAASKPVKIALK